MSDLGALALHFGRVLTAGDGAEVLVSDSARS